MTQTILTEKEREQVGVSIFTAIPSFVFDAIEAAITAKLGSAPMLEPVERASEIDKLRQQLWRAHRLLREVSACFTRDDDLPDDILPRIDDELEGPQ